MVKCSFSNAHFFWCVLANEYFQNQKTHNSEWKYWKWTLKYKYFEQLHFKCSWTCRWSWPWCMTFLQPHVAPVQRVRWPVCHLKYSSNRSTESLAAFSARNNMSIINRRWGKWLRECLCVSPSLPSSDVCFMNELIMVSLQTNINQQGELDLCVLWLEWLIFIKNVRHE